MNSLWRYNIKEAVGKMLRAYGKKVIYKSKTISQKDRGLWETPLGKKELVDTISLPLHQHKHRAICRKQCSTNIHYLARLHCALPPHSLPHCYPLMLASVDLPLPDRPASVLVLQDPSRREPEAHKPW